MKNIIVPVDFSDASHNAGAYAVSLAHYFDAKIYLVHVVEPPMIANDSFLASVMITQAEIVEANSKQLTNEMELFNKIYPVSMEAFVREGFTTDVIRDLASETDADLIVMGMKGKGESRSVFGSTTTRVVRHIALPVLLVPSKATFNAIEKIALASDFDPETESKQYRLLMKLAARFKSKFMVVNVAVGGRDLRQSQVIGKMKTSMAFSEYPTEFHTIKEDSVEEGLEDFLEDNEHDLLVMLARGHSFFERLFGKVHTKTMSYKTRKPLLILHDK